MTKTKAILATASALIVSTMGSEVLAGVTVYKDGDKYIKIGGRVQLQYHRQDPDTGSPDDETTDEVFFRRLRPYIEGSLHKDWKGKIQWDMGKAEDDNEIAVKDAYMQYSGISNTKLIIGNALFPFSREQLTSSKKQQLVERTFVGDHNYGVPERNAGVHIKGGTSSKLITYGASFASAAIDPDSEKLDFDTPVNSNSDFNQGWIVGGRIDWHPMGEVKFDQGDFNGKPKFAVGLAAFSWSNDDDNNTNTDPATGLDTSAGDKPDVDEVTGAEVSAAFRGFGLSVDAQYNTFSADTVDGTVTSGIYQNGDAELDSYALEGGYMLIPSKFELVAGYQAIEADADVATEDWTRTSVGLNWFFHKHDIKLQLTHRMGENLNGIDGNDEDETFLQAQYVF